MKIDPNQKEWVYRYRTGSGKIVRIVVKALDAPGAAFQARKQIAIRFKGKTYKKIEGPICVKLSDHC